jgi:hypothetical protein
MEEMRNAYKILAGKLQDKKSLGRPRSRWEDNIKMDLKDIGWDEVYWIHLALDKVQWHALVNMIMHLWVS